MLMNESFALGSLVSFAAAFLVSFYLFRALYQVAHRVNLVDHPSKRKIHDGPIPLIGGIGIFLGVVSGLLLSPFGLGEYRIFFLGCGVLVLTGVLDDHRDLSATRKIIAQLGVAGLLVTVGGVVVTDIGDVFDWRDGNELGTGIFAIPLTIIAVVGVLNSINMVDGHDGVAGSIFLVSILGLITMCELSGFQKHQHILILFALSTAAFLIYNLPCRRIGLRKIFLGDAGSLLLGLVLVFFLIEISEEQGSLLKTASAPWIIGIPLLDLMGIMCLRVIAREHVFKADRRHIHHFLGDIGLGRIKTLLILVVAHIVFVSVGLAGSIWNWPDKFLFWPMFLILVFYVVVRSRWSASD